ncbi:flagella synthesis protein FlgN [Halomonas sp. GT]|uniref:flagella synthesis protein FlgN n=1 Tax=Halomonas sp. GT TaxID=1971364 RepID=UPI0009F4A57D|nr:flagellar export chaperone FlgN [Halomonas sp. GT]
MGLSRLLSDQLQRLDELVLLLSDEQAQLTKGSIDGDTLSAIALKKQALLVELERIEQLRRNVQTKLGYTEGALGAKQAANDADCLITWENLLEKSERVSRMNALTGQMLSLRMKHNQEMLDYIRQIAEKTLYKPNGRNNAQPGRFNASA